VATIIEFQLPSSFQGRHARVPSQRCGKVLPFRGNLTDNTLTSVPPAAMLRIMFASETEQTRRLPEEIISDSPILRIVAREGERE